MRSLFLVPCLKCLWYNRSMFGKMKSGKPKLLRKFSEQGERTDKYDDQDDMYGRIASNVQLQDKLIAYFVNDDNVDAVADDVDVTEGQKLQIKQALETGQIADYRIAKFLLKVLSPIQDLKTNLNGIYQQIVKVPMQKQILAVATGHDRHNWQKVDAADLEDLLSKPQQGHVDYRTPVGFDEFRKKFLRGIRDEATPEQMAEYVAAMDEVERCLYGRRFEYYQQIVLMSRKEGREQAETVMAEPERVMTTEPVVRLESGLQRIDESRGNEALGRAVVDGDAWVQDGTEYRLTAQGLASAGVAPAYETILEERTVFLSESFRLSDGRGAIIAYVADGDVFKVRGFCQNIKNGMWYYVPETIRGARGEGIAQIGEGYGEESTLLPLALQATIMKIVEEVSLKAIAVVNADFLLAGTAAAYDSQQEYREAVSRGMARGDYYREVDSSPVMEAWKMGGRGKNAPQLISINNEMVPSFQNMVVKFDTYSVLVGQEEICGFASNNNQTIWGLGNDEWGRVWCNNIEVMSPVTSTGCRRDWMDAGDMTTPLYENSTQAGDFGDSRDVRRGMVGMWSQYVSRIPLMQEYVKWRSERQG